MSEHSPIRARLNLLILKASKYGETKRYEMVTVKRKNGTTFQRKQLVGGKKKEPISKKKGTEKKEKVKPTPKAPQIESKPVKKPKEERSTKSEAKPPKPNGKRPAYLNGASPKTLKEYDILDSLRQKEDPPWENFLVNIHFSSENKEVFTTDGRIMGVSKNPEIYNKKFGGLSFNPKTMKDGKTNNLLDNSTYRKVIPDFTNNPDANKFVVKFPENKKFEKDKTVYIYNENGNVKLEYNRIENNRNNLLGRFKSDYLNKLFVKKNNEAKKLSIQGDKSIKKPFIIKIEDFND